MTSQQTKSYAKDEHTGKITDEGIERMRARIGVEMPKKPWQTWNEVATLDAIRHFAYGYGDDNPLWIDAEHGAKSRWRNNIAPPSFLYSMGVTEKKEISEEDRKKGGGALAGVHAFWSGDEVEWFRPVYVGDKIWEKRFIQSVEKKQSAFAGVSVVTRDRTMYINNRGEVVCNWDRLFVRAERKTTEGGERKKHEKIERGQYAEEDLKKIEAAYDAEERRGDSPRYWEDVKEGDIVTPVVHGPLLMSDEIAWHQGNGRWEIFPHHVGLKLRRRHPGFYTLNDWGVPEAVMRCHWDDNYARKVGNPFAYDNGIMRSSWMMHLVTNWMGDDGWLWKVKDRIIAFNYYGDTSWVTGKVARKYIAQENGAHVAEIEVSCDDQRGRKTALATATVLLPSKEAGPVLLPQPERGMEGHRIGARPPKLGS
ncbi:MAG: acyl dehydratase [Chloroflexi bacterium]|nr:acyl dehydratase [Chloroflexota bacterium]